MSTGKIFVANKNGVYVLKFVGDVRLTLCAGLDRFLETMAAAPDLSAVVIDLCDAECIDSTALGFIAKISILTQDILKLKPTVVSSNPDITRILVSMGFEQVFKIITHRIDNDESLSELDSSPCSECETKEKVIEAHKILMGLNKKNKQKFQELVSMLESS
jgi:anti-anti-sigma factor